MKQKGIKAKAFGLQRMEKFLYLTMLNRLSLKDIIETSDIIMAMDRRHTTMTALRYLVKPNHKFLTLDTH